MGSVSAPILGVSQNGFLPFDSLSIKRIHAKRANEH